MGLVELVVGHRVGDGPGPVEVDRDPLGPDRRRGEEESEGAEQRLWPSDEIRESVRRQIPAVRFGSADAEEDLFGIQTEMGMMARDLGELNSKPAMRTRVEWDISLVLASRDCAARLRGITNAIA